jgi:ketosteroid isomerase-like protein
MSRTDTPAHVLGSLVQDFNVHDLDALVGHFADDYTLTDPAHPTRSFVGSAQVRRNWGMFFSAVPDIRLEVVGRVVTDDGFWLDGLQLGTRTDGARVENSMVFIARVDDGRITSARIWVTPVERGGPDIDAVFAEMAGHGVSEPRPAGDLP